MKNKKETCGNCNHRCWDWIDKQYVCLHPSIRMMALESVSYATLDMCHPDDAVHEMDAIKLDPCPKECI